MAEATAARQATLDKLGGPIKANAMRRAALKAAAEAFAAGDGRALEKFMAEVVSFNVYTDILPSTWASMFMEVQNLEEDQVPSYVTDHRQEHSVSVIGESGGSPTSQHIQYDTPTNLNLYYMSTEDIEFPIRSIQTGAYNLLEKKQAEAEFDLGIKHDIDIKALLDANVVTSGLKAQYNFHSSVDQTNYRDYNAIKYTTGGLNSLGNEYLNATVIRTLCGICNEWGVALRAIVCSPKALPKGLWQDVTIVSGYTGGDVVDPRVTVPQYIHDQIWSTGRIVSMFNHTFALIPSNMLPDGTAYIATSKSAGIWARKPSMRETLVDTSFNARKNNRSSVVIREAEVMYMPGSYQANFMKLTHRT